MHIDLTAVEKLRLIEELRLIEGGQRGSGFVVN